MGVAGLTQDTTTSCCQQHCTTSRCIPIPHASLQNEAKA